MSTAEERGNLNNPAAPIRTDITHGTKEEKDEINKFLATGVYTPKKGGKYRKSKKFKTSKKSRKNRRRRTHRKRY